MLPLLSAAPEPAKSVVPLMAPRPATSAADVAATLQAARRAQELGLPTVAAGLYQELLARPDADRAALTLPLVTALLDAGRVEEADRTLNALQTPRGPDWHLRMALLAAQEKRLDVASREANRVNVDQLTRPDRAWFWFMQGMLADIATPRDVPKANEFYVLAEKEAPNDLARATFLAAGLRVRLTLVNYSPADVELARKQYEANRDKGTRGYELASDYAVMRDAIGGKDEAVKFLSGVLARMPKAEKAWTDQFRRLLGMIGDRSRGGAGRNALTQLLETGTTPDLQRQALQLLAQASANEPERGLFRVELDKLIGATTPSAVLDGLLLMRAQWALTDTPKNYAIAERRANELKDKFPGSPLRPNAFAVLATSAWEQKRYRLAADDARQAREALNATPAAKSPTEAKVVAQAAAELQVMEAEASFRAGMLGNSASDYRTAAEAYTAVLKDPPAGISAGDLLFQRALAEIRADADPKELIKVIDGLEADARFDPANRWEAEWSLARALNTHGKTEEALVRVSQLLDAAEPKAGAIAPDLRARMSWLQAKLSFEANHPELTLQLVAKLETVTRDVDAALRTEIASTAALLKAQAEFRLERETDALATLAKLRTDYPASDAAIYSYLVTAAHYAEPGRDKIQDAQRSLRALIDNPAYKDSEYIPYALFQLALLSERLGTEKDLREANERIEELVRPDRVPAAPPDLVFAARLKQGDLLRTLNQFPQAQRAYEDLVNNPKYAMRRDVVLAQLRLAECHNAQSSTDPSGSHADLAQSMFEELLYRVSAPDDVRVEAGYNLGNLLERRGQADKARDIWWRDVITPFLVNAPRPLPAGAKRSYWLARTLLDLGSLLEQKENLDEARRVYVQLRDSHLGYGEAIAVERLERLGVTTTSKEG
jgi:hypothetical protein